jgi:tetratricopeptide (TPR) repeat protein
VKNEDEIEYSIYMNDLIKDYEKAVFYYTKAIELDRIKPSQIHFERATAYLYLGKMDKAIEDLKLFNKTPYFTEKEKKEKISSYLLLSLF